MVKPRRCFPESIHNILIVPAVADGLVESTPVLMPAWCSSAPLFTTACSAARAFRGFIRQIHRTSGWFASHWNFICWLPRRYACWHFSGPGFGLYRVPASCFPRGFASWRLLKLICPNTPEESVHGLSWLCFFCSSRSNAASRDTGLSFVSVPLPDLSPLKMQVSAVQRRNGHW